MNDSIIEHDLNTYVTYLARMYFMDNDPKFLLNYIACILNAGFAGFDVFLLTKEFD